jgi:hypothetical protein|tara:strand:+ start:1601 stop:1840 length:240 start_codon:yes stop_codon:yes gene_type:complete
MPFQELLTYWEYRFESKIDYEELGKMFIEPGKHNWECYAITRDKVYFKKKKTGIIYNLIGLTLAGFLSYNIYITNFKDI